MEFFLTLWELEFIVSSINQASLFVCLFYFSNSEILCFYFLSARIKGICHYQLTRPVISFKYTKAKVLCLTALARLTHSWDRKDEAEKAGEQSSRERERTVKAIKEEALEGSNIISCHELSQLGSPPPSVSDVTFIWTYNRSISYLQLK